MSEPWREQPEDWVAVDDDPNKDAPQAEPVDEDDGWELAGRFVVDAGLCWVGDPCHIPLDRLADWPGFCDWFHDRDHDRRGTGTVPLPPDRPHWAVAYGGVAGVVVTTGIGDGFYDVEVRRTQDAVFGERIAELRIRFLDDLRFDDEEEDEEAADDD